MNLKLGIKEDEQSDIKILQILNGTETLGLIKPNDYRDFTLKLYASRTGLVPLSGLLIRDMVISKDILF